MGLRAFPKPCLSYVSKAPPTILFHASPFSHSMDSLLLFTILIRDYVCYLLPDLKHLCCLRTSGTAEAGLLTLPCPMNSQPLLSRARSSNDATTESKTSFLSCFFVCWVYWNPSMSWSPAHCISDTMRCHNIWFLEFRAGNYINAVWS